MCSIYFVGRLKFGKISREDETAKKMDIENLITKGKKDGNEKSVNE